MPQIANRPLAYQFRLEFWQHSGRRVLEVPLGEADFARAVEVAFFDGLRRGHFTDYELPCPGMQLEPKFLRDDSPPHASGFAVVLPAADGSVHRKEFDAHFLHAQAQHMLVDRMLNGEVEAETLQYRLAAYLDDEVKPAGGGLGMMLEAEETRVPIQPGSRRGLGKTLSWDQPLADDLPVVIPRRVLLDALEQACGEPENEVGGFLLGHLRRDSDTAELFLEVTAHVPAEYTEATGTSVTFTADTWARAREVVAWRGEGELFAGWCHSHPFRFCAECPAQPPPECVSKVLFFSTDDHFLMGLTFAQPFMVALQTAVEPRLEQALGHLPVRLYGWRDGEVVARGFEVIED